MSSRLPSRARAGTSRVRRAGFTLVELMISMVVVAVIGAALTRLMLAQNRFYDRQKLQRDARNVSRAALNILNADARMIEETNALTTATPTFIVFHVPWAVGVSCGAATVAILPVDQQVWLESKDATSGVGVRQANGTYVRAALAIGTNLTPHANHATCEGLGITPVPGSTSLTVLNASVTPGTPIMLYRQLRYRLGASTMVAGKWGLYRQVGTAGVEEEIVAPLETTSSFQSFNANNPVPGVAGTLAQISGIRFNLVGASERAAGGRSAVEQASLVTSVYFRNRQL